MILTVRTIIELMGYPEDHVNKVMENILEKLKKTGGIEIVKKDLAPVEKIKEKMFSTFVELEMKFKNIKDLYLFCIDFLPTSIEILDTEEVKFSAIDFTSSLNEVIAYFHKYNVALHNTQAQLNEVLRKLEKTPTSLK